MMIISLLLTLIAHVLADFFFQTGSTVARKEQLQLAGFASHGIAVFGILVLLLHGYLPGQIIIYSLLVTIVHLMLDYTKELLNRHCKTPQAKFSVFCGDQLLHGLTIILIWQCFNLQSNQLVTNFYHWLFSPRLLAVVKAEPALLVGTGSKILLVILTYLAVGWGGSVIVEQVLRFFTVTNVPAQHGNLKPGIGRWIGIIERCLILTLTLNNSLTAVVFVFTAKSIARFSELNDRSFAEYYLVGTLLSTALAVGGGLIAGLLLPLC